MNRKIILQCREYLESLGLTRWNRREWRFNDKLLNHNYCLVYDYDKTFMIYTRTEIRKNMKDKYELFTNSWIDFESGDMKEFKEKVNKAVDNYKKAAQKIKELKAQEDFKND